MKKKRLILQIPAASIQRCCVNKRILVNCKGIKTAVDHKKKRIVEKKEIDPQSDAEDVKEYIRFDGNANFDKNVFPLSSTKIFNNILVFMDLQKMSIYNEESTISQVG